MKKTGLLNEVLGCGSNSAFNFIVQSAILPFLRIAGIQPDTLMVLVTCFGLLGGTGYGTFTGLAGGLLQDILYGSVGLNGLHYMVIGF